MMSDVPLVDSKTGCLNFEWVHCYAKENNCDVIAAFREGMNRLGNLYIQLKDFQQKFLQTPHEVLRDYEFYSVAATAQDRRREEREQPNKNSRTLPVISS